MNSPKFLRQAIGLSVVVFLVGYGAPTATPTPLPTSPPSAPPPILSAQPPPLTSSPTSGAPSLFKLIKIVTVTPDETYQMAGLARIHYVRATDRLVMILAALAPDDASGSCTGKPSSYFRAHVYKEYTLDLQPTGNHKVFSCLGMDAVTLMVDDTLYFAPAAQNLDNGSQGWTLTKYDAVTWKSLNERRIDVSDVAVDNTDGPSLAYVNGRIDLFHVYMVSGTIGIGVSKHRFFSTDLQPLETRILSEAPSIFGGSLIYADGVYYLITSYVIASTNPSWEVYVGRYDQDWKYLDTKTLRKQATLPSGALFDGKRFYVAYLDSRCDYPQCAPILTNLHVAAFDRDWNLIEDIAVTNFAWTDMTVAGSPGLLLHGGRLYVTYTLDGVKQADSTYMQKLFFQSYVTVYDVSGGTVYLPLVVKSYGSGW